HLYRRPKTRAGTGKYHPRDTYTLRRPRGRRSARQKCQLLRETAPSRRAGWSQLMNGAAVKKIRAVIVDDEELARQMLREFLANNDEIEIVAECANGFEAVKTVTELNPDLLFLDIQMPKLDGFEVLELVGGERAVVFVTAFDEYAIRAFEIHAVDYLLKPFNAERFPAGPTAPHQPPNQKTTAATDL